ncbi:MAG: gliding motility-associated C-terminal domain-containing protein [Bacteroidia bacterium]|nr:gliding motility-associated C-terminal domain-containing protein [Bacteroidia bacterium]
MQHYTRVYNNYISGQQVGVHVKSATSSNNELYFNSFYNTQRNLNFSKPGTNANWKLKNNIFYTTSNTAADACIYIKGTNPFGEIDYNLYYAPNAAGVANFGNTKYTNLTAWKAVTHQLSGGNGDGNSIEGNPEYFDPSNHLLDIGPAAIVNNTGLHINDINNDLYGYSRKDIPTIGANEITPSLIINTKMINGKFTYHLSGNGISVIQATGSKRVYPINRIEPGISKTYKLYIMETEYNSEFTFLFDIDAYYKISNVRGVYNYYIDNIDSLAPDSLTPGDTLYNNTLAIDTLPLDSTYYKIVNGCELVFLNEENTIDFDYNSLTIYLVLQGGLFFTPNNDGFFDKLEIKGVDNAINFLFKIFDINDQLVYETHNKSDAWNGLHKDTGQLVLPGAYKYALQADGEVIQGQFLISY